MIRGSSAILRLNLSVNPRKIQSKRIVAQERRRQSQMYGQDGCNPDATTLASGNAKHVAELLVSSRYGHTNFMGCPACEGESSAPRSPSFFASS
jgi:hypothetical protein